MLPDEASPGTSPPLPRWIHALVVALLLALCMARAVGTDLRRPFDEDELLTTWYYTWAGVHADGEQRVLRHIDDFHGLDRPGLGHSLIGLYCAAGRWPEPNNHIVHSVLVSLALAVGPRSEATARLPALLGGLLFALSIYIYSVRRGMGHAAPFVALAAWCIPYVVLYSQSARGYSWMLALQVLTLLAADELRRRRASLALWTVVGMLVVLSVLNIVSLALDWCFPIFLVLFFVRPDGEDAGARLAWRRGLVTLGIAVGVALGIFFVSHLPAVFSSLRQYGLPFQGVSGFVTTAGGIARYLLPDPLWISVGVLGAAGMVAAALRTRGSMFGLAGAASVLVSAAHFYATHRFPYERTMGYLLPVLLLGFGYVLQAGWHRLPDRLRLPAWALALFVWGCVLVPVSGRPVRDAAMDALLAGAGQSGQPGSTLMWTGPGVDWATTLYRPSQWVQAEPLTAGQTMTLAWVMRTSRTTEVNPLSLGDGTSWDPTQHLAQVIDTGPYRLFTQKAQVQPFGREAALGARIYFWYPDVSRLGISGGRQSEFLRASGVGAAVRRVRVQVKLDVYSRIDAFVVPAGTSPQMNRVRAVLREALRRFGGRVVVVVPE